MAKEHTIADRAAAKQCLVTGHVHVRQRAVERKGTAIRLTETIGGITSVR